MALKSSLSPRHLSTRFAVWVVCTLRTWYQRRNGEDAPCHCSPLRGECCWDYGLRLCRERSFVGLAFWACRSLTCRIPERRAQGVTGLRLALLVVTGVTLCDGTKNSPQIKPGATHVRTGPARDPQRVTFQQNIRNAASQGGKHKQAPTEAQRRAQGAPPAPKFGTSKYNQWLDKYGS